MNNKSFFWELQDLVTQFLAAFDDTVISRFNKKREAQEEIAVRYVFGPKQRVMYDIVNKAQNLTLPVIAVNVNSITRDPSLTFNKIEPAYFKAKDNEYGTRSVKAPMPVPVNIDISFSILTRYMQDMDQIISNFVPYTNPYIILSWQIPKEYGLANTTEIRTEVLWNGTLSYNTPTDLAYSDKFRAIVDTSFTIKGWLFREIDDPVSLIYKVTSNFINVNLAKRIYSIDDAAELSANTETVVISAIPSITNLFYTNSSGVIPLYNPYTIYKLKDNHFMLYGKRFNYNNNFYLSSNVVNFYNNYEPIITAKSPLISGYRLNASEFNVINDSIATIKLTASSITSTGAFTIVTANSAGWATTNNGYAISIE